MTLQPTANREDVTKNGGTLGNESVFAHTFPDNFETITSGGGSFFVDHDGLSLGCGGTSGDEASLRGNHADLLGDPGSVRRCEILYCPRDIGGGNTDWTAKTEIGWPGTSTGESHLGYLDYTNDQFVTNDETQAVSNPVSAGGATCGLLIIEHDGNVDETTFRHVVNGGEVEEVTLNASTDSGRYAVKHESTGANDQLRILYCRQIGALLNPAL